MQMAREALAPAMRLGLRVFLNGTIEQAQELDFHGVHLREALISKYLEKPSQIEIATSTHSLESIQKSVSIGAAFCLFSPIFKPLSKDIAPVGIDKLRSITQQANIDIVALGGITPERVAPCIQAGAKGVACLSSVMRTKKPRKSIQSLIKQHSMRHVPCVLTAHQLLIGHSGKC
jgi:thiamine monophosphate synthase